MELNIFIPLIQNKKGFNLDNELVELVKNSIDLKNYISQDELQNRMMLVLQSCMNILTLLNYSQDEFEKIYFKHFNNLKYDKNEFKGYCDIGINTESKLTKSF